MEISGKNGASSTHQADAHLAAAERDLIDQLRRVLKARRELGVRRGREPKKILA